MRNIPSLLQDYDLKNLTIGVLGGHSALEVCCGAKKYGFKTVAICQKGREKTYSQYFKTRDNLGCVDKAILVDKFGDVVNEKVQKELLGMNTILIHNRYFWVYCDFDKIEKDLKIPIFGTREMVKLEERDQPKNQYYLLQKAGIRIPRIIPDPAQIDRLVIVKVNEQIRGYERAFFLASSPQDYRHQSNVMIANHAITEKALTNAVIEEYIIGAQVNFNYFYSPLTKELEFMGTDTRRQTSLDGFLRIPADEQLEVLKHVRPKMIETGHMTCTVKESLLEKIYDIGERFVATTQKECPPGIIGPFALQGAVAAEEGREELVIFDVSMRIPGSPGTKFTPYSGYLYGESISYGERIALEIKKAVAEEKLEKILT